MEIRKELEGKSIGVFDAETDGFLATKPKVHCITIIDAITNSTSPSADTAGFVEDYLSVLDEFDVLVGHNIIGFDLPLLKQKYGWEPEKHVIILDTLWMSRMYRPDLDGGHSLGSWGQRLGNEKIEYHPVSDPEQPVYNAEEKNPSKNPCWTGSIYTETMGEYCDQDVALNVEVFWKLLGFLEFYSWQSIICEMDTAALIQRQMEHGFVFDYKAAEILYAELMDRQGALEELVLETFHPLPKLIREVQPKVRLDGTVSPVGLKKHMELMGNDIFPVPDFTRHEKEYTKWIPCEPDNPGGYCGTDGTYGLPSDGHIKKYVTYQSGAFSDIEWPAFSLGSRQQIAERLILAGYKLKEFTEKGNPIINDETLKDAADAGIPEAIPLAEYFMITKRVGMVRDWLAKAVWNEEQGVHRIHGYVNSYGANSSRMTHSSPNVAQVPSPKSDYGKECRSLFCSRTGYKLVGCDASGLELRVLAHYMNDATYTKTLLEGDIHTVNQIAAGLPTRDSAKTFIYSFLYGGGDALIGANIGGKAKEGKKIKKEFLDKTPALKRLREGVLAVASKRNWLKGMDGRILRIRSPHSALNTLLQGAGAIICKYWLIEFMKQLDAEGIYAEPCANIHDEASVEVKEEDTARVAIIMEKAFLTVSSMLQSNCLLEGEAKIGDTWYDVH